MGLALTVDIDQIGCILLGGGEEISAGSKVHGTGEIVRVPVGQASWAGSSIRSELRSTMARRSVPSAAIRSTGPRPRSSSAIW